MSGAVPLLTEAVDWDNPAAYYLGDPSLAELADVNIRHSGLLLPVHSQVLATQCGVMRDLFRSMRESADGGAAVGSKRPREESATIELESPFKDHSLQAVVFTLRFLYNYTDMSGPSLDAIKEHLLGVVQLAHSLDASHLLKAIDRLLAEKMQQAEAAWQWVATAETYQLDQTWGEAVRSLSGALIAAGDASWLGASADVDKLSNIASHRTVAKVLSTVLAWVRSQRPAAVGVKITRPSWDLLRFDFHGHPLKFGSLTFEIPNISQHLQQGAAATVLPAKPVGSNTRLSCGLTVWAQSSQASQACLMGRVQCRWPGLNIRYIKVGTSTSMMAGGHVMQVWEDVPVCTTSVHFDFKPTILPELAAAAAAGRFLGGRAIFEVKVTWIEELGADAEQPRETAAEPA